MVLPILYIALGIFCAINGLKILLTGKLSAGEEAKIASYSNKGARTYKLINAIISIVAGLCIIGQSALTILERNKIIEDTLTYQIILWGIVILMVVIYFIVASKCKKMTDDE